MKYRLTLDKNVDFSPAAEVEEIFQNVRTILTTPKGTVPRLRDFGFSFEHLDKPIHLAQSLTRTEMIEAIERWEPRAKVEKIEFEESAEDAMSGLSRPVITLSIGENNE